MNIDFVKTPFTNNPTMSRHDGPIFNKKPDSRYLIEKQKEIEIFGENLLGETELSKSKNLLFKLLNLFSIINNIWPISQFYAERLGL